MPDQKAFYIVTVAGGKCLQNTQDAHGALDCLPQESKAQKWFIESDPSNPNVLAFKSALDGKYLRNNEPHKIDWGKIGMGEKQWWTLEKGRNPGACLIRSNACTRGASYLNDYKGHYVDRNKVHMWQYVAKLQFWLDWYFLPTDAPFNPKAMQAAADQGPSEAEKKRQKDVEDREAALKEKEKAMTDREAAFKQQQEKRTAADNEAAEQAKKGEADLAKARRELEEMRTALERREKGVTDSEAALKQQQDKKTAANSQAAEQDKQGQADLAKARKDLDEKRAALEKREKDVANREAAAKQEKAKKDAALEKREKEIADREAALKQTQNKNDAASSVAAKRTASSADDDAEAREKLDKREADLAEREKALADQKAELEQLRAQSKSTSEDDAGAKAANSTANDSSPSGEDETSRSASDLDLLKAENDNLKLKLKIQALEQQLKDARKPSANSNAKAPPRRTAPSQTNGASAKREPVVYECGHVAYPPPRKLKRHVVGMLYEGLDRPFELSERQRATLGRHSHHG